MPGWRQSARLFISSTVTHSSMRRSQFPYQWDYNGVKQHYIGMARDSEKQLQVELHSSEEAYSW